MFRSKKINKILVSIVIIFALIINLVRFGLFLLSHNPQLLTEQLSKSLGHTVTIGRISARLDVFQPEFELENVAISDNNGKQLLSFKRGYTRLRLLPLMTLGKIKPSLMAVDHARFSLKKDLNGNLIVVGFPGDGNFFSTMINAGRYSLTNSKITLINQDQATIVIDQFDLKLESNSGLSQLSANAAISEINSRLELIANYSKVDNASYSGDVYIKGTSLQYSDFKRFWPFNLPIEPGIASFNVWGQIQESSLRSVKGDINIEAIDWKLNKNLAEPLLELPDQFRSALWIETSEDRWQLVLNNIAFDTGLLADDQEILIESVKTNTKQSRYGLRVSALQLEKIVPIVKQLSATSATTKQITGWLSDTTIQGRLHNLDIHYDQDDVDPIWSVCAGFSQLQIQRKDRISVTGNLSGRICADQQSARLKMETKNASVFIPDCYRHPLKLSNLNGKMHWQNTNNGWKLTTEDMQLATVDLNLDLDLYLKANNNTPWLLNTTVNFDLANAENLNDYLPGNILAPDVHKWLANAFRGGAFKNGIFTYQGQLVNSPFKNKAAVSTADFRLVNTSIQVDLTEDWPLLSQFNADLHFKNGQAIMNVESGNSLGVNIRNGTIAVKDLTQLDNVHITTQLETSLQIAENYILNSPLEEKIGEIVHFVHPQGDSSYNLNFMIPVHSETDEFWINGDVDFHNATLELSDIDLIIDQVNGGLQFTNETVTAESINATIDSQETTIDIIDKQNTIAIKAGALLRDAFLHQRWPWLQILQGNAYVNANVEVAKHSPQKATAVIVKLRSDLQGMRVDLPAPLNKSAAQNKNLAVKINLADTHLVPIEVHYGKDALADLTLHKKTFENWVLDRAHLMIGKGHMPSDDGAKFSLKADLPEWNLSELSAIKALNSDVEFDSNASNIDPANHANINLDVIIDVLKFEDTNLGSVALNLDKQVSGWSGTISGSIAEGTINYETGARTMTVDHSTARSKLNLKLDYFNLENTDKLKDSYSLITDGYSPDRLPQKLPQMDIMVKEFIWGDVNLGQMNLTTSAITDGLLINQFSMDGTEHQLTTEGRWVSQQSQMQTTLGGSLVSKNMAHFLHQFGIYEDIRKTAANIDFNLEWQSSPFQMDWQSLNGKMNLKLEHGRLLGIEPGVGRALGLFSLSAWERRLRFDFSDVVDDGFAYDSVKADFALLKGNAYSSNLEMDGVAARVNFAGRVGLLDKDINAAVTVIPRSSIALPLAGAVGGPIGLGAGLVAQQVVGDQFETLSSSEYTISGSWTDPQVTLVPENGGIFTRMIWQLQKLTGTQNSIVQ